VRRWRQYYFVWSFLLLLVFCSLMVLRQFYANQARHVELREAFILLHSRGYVSQAQRLFARLLAEMDHQPNQVLYDDFQRTMMLVDPGSKLTNNLIWVYHWTVSNELEKRSEKTLLRALKLAEETK